MLREQDQCSAVSRVNVWRRPGQSSLPIECLGHRHITTTAWTVPPDHAVSEGGVRVLGINATNHEPPATPVDGQVVAASDEERLFRRKGENAGFLSRPWNCGTAALAAAPAALRPGPIPR